jgi:hypothetical protein
MSESGEFGNYEDPRYSSSQGRYVGSGDAGGTWQPLSMAAPLGQYEGSGDAGGTWREFTPEETAAAAARIEADRIAELERASGILANNPLSVTGDKIQTRYGDVNVSRFNPITADGQPITGETAAQLTDPQSGVPIFLSNPNDPTSYTYDNTGVPAISGTVAQQAALYKPYEDKGPFGTLFSDLASAARDPYFHKFLAATAAIAGGGAALNSAYGVGGLGAAPVAEAFPVVLGDSIVTSGGLGGGAGAIGGAGELGGLGTLTAEQASNLMLYDILPAGLQTPASGAAGLFNITPAQALQAARFGLPIVGALTGGSRVAQAGGQGGGGQGVGGQGGGGQGGGGQGYTQGPWNTFMNPTTIRQEGSGTTVMQNPELAMLEPSLANQLAQSGAIPSNLAGSNVPSVNYYSYGTPPQTDYFGQATESPLMAAKGGGIKKPQRLAMGGLPMPEAAEDEHIPEFITGATGHYVKGRGDGQSDDIPAMLADGEYVFDADTVAQLGNGSSDAGAKFLDSFRHAVREHKRSAPVDKIPPKASPLQYVKEAMKRTS